jgi:hypothetical protein
VINAEMRKHLLTQKNDARKYVRTKRCAEKVRRRDMKYGRGLIRVMTVRKGREGATTVT